MPRHRTNESLGSRILTWPIKCPWWTLAVAGVIGVAGAISASRISPVSSLTPMFARDDPAVQAMLRLANEFRIADNLLVLVELGQTGPANGSRASASASSASTSQADSPAGDKQRLIQFAKRLKREISKDERAAAMTDGVVFRRGRAARAFVREQVVPAGIYYLNEAQLKAFRQRLQPDQIRQQIRRNEALLRSASPMADVISKQILQDPLRLYEFLLASIHPGGAQGEADGGGQGAMAGGLGSNPGQAPAMLSENGRSLLIRVHGVKAAGELDYTKRFMPTMRRMVEQARPGNLRVAYTGSYPMAELSATKIRRDMIRSVIVSIIILHILFLIAYRWVLSFPLTFVPVGAGILTGFGVFGLISARLTPVTAASGAILAGLGVDYCIHYLSHYFSQGRDETSDAVLRQTSIRLGRPLAAACVTSLIGFAAIGASSVPALQDFAALGALGMGCIFLATLTVLPAGLSLADRWASHSKARHTRPAARSRERRNAKPPLRLHLDSWIRRIGQYRWWSIGLSLTVIGLAALSLTLGGGPGLESDPSVLQPQPSKPMRTQRRVGKLFPDALESFPVLLHADSPRQLTITAHEARNRMMRTDAARAGLIQPFGLATLLPDPRLASVHDQAVREIDADRVISDLRSAIEDSAFDPKVYAGYMAFLGRVLRNADPPTVSTLRQYPQLAQTLLSRAAVEHPDQPITRALTMVRMHGQLDDPARSGEVIRSQKQALKPMAGAIPTGDPLIRLDLKDTIVNELQTLLLIAAVAVTAWLFLVFHRPGRVLLCGLPTIVCFFLLFAVMGAVGAKLNILNVIALPMLAGIGVDDGIFLVSIARRYKDHASSGHQTSGDLVQELASSCHAITMTSLTTALAFGSLMLTQTPAIRSLGLVLAVGMISCWFAAMFLLAPILMLVNQRAEPGGSPP